MWRLVMVVVVSGVLWAGCTQPVEPTPDLQQAVVATPTPTPKPTRSAVPTRTPVPTWTPIPSTHTPVPPSVRLTHSLNTVYYPITGTTTRDIFDSVEANGPDLGQVLEGRFTSGLTESESSYEIEFLNHGESCELQSVVISLDLVVTLPEHSDPSSLSGLQLRRWQDFAEGVAVHEQTHVDIFIEGTEAFKNGVEHLPERFSDCDALKASVSPIWELESIVTDQKQERFHESEELLSQRLRGPVQQHIDDNELELAELQDELTRVSSEIDELELQIDGIDGSMQPYDARIAAIEDQYPDLVLPSDTFDEYERLQEEWNGLNDLRNGFVTQVNALVERHNRIIEDFNQLTKQTNQLIEELAWGQPLAQSTPQPTPTSRPSSTPSPTPLPTATPTPTATPSSLSLMAFYSERDGNGELYVMNADGTNQTRLTNYPTGDAEPNFLRGCSPSYRMQRSSERRYGLLQLDDPMTMEVLEVLAGAEDGVYAFE